MDGENTTTQRKVVLHRPLLVSGGALPSLLLGGTCLPPPSGRVVLSSSLPSRQRHPQERGGKAAPLKGRKGDHHSTELNLTSVDTN